MKHFKRYLSLSALPLAVLAFLMVRYAVDIPFWDEWSTAELMQKYHNGTLSFMDFFANHNEHRIITGKFIMFISALLTDWNLYVNLVINVLFAAVSSVVVYYALDKTSLARTKKDILYFVSAFLIFSFNQHHNFLWGFQMQIFMSVCFNLLALALIAYPRCVIPAALSAWIATFSFANGMLIWPCGAVLLIAYPGLKDKYRKLAVWLFSAVVCIALYFYRYRNPQPPILEKLYFFITHPHLVVAYFFSYFASAITYGRVVPAFFLGLLGSAMAVFSLFTFWTRRSWDVHKAFWLSVLLYVVLSSAVTVYGRIDTSSQRYFSINMVFWIAVPVLFFTALEELSGSGFGVRYYLLFAAVLLPLTLTDDAMHEAKREYKTRLIFKHQMEQGIYDEKLFMRYIFPFRYIAGLIPVMKEYGMRNFGNAPDNIVFDDFVRVEGFRPEMADTGGVNGLELEDCRAEKGSWIVIDGSCYVPGMKYLGSNKVKVFVLLWDDGNNAYGAEIEHRTFDQRVNEGRYAEALDTYLRLYFKADWIYYGNLPAGKYSTAIKIVPEEGREYFAPLNFTVEKQ